MKIDNIHTILKYPKRIYNEWEVLEIYKEKFPGIVKEYQRVVERIYCNPKKYQKIVENKAEKFDSIFNSILKEFQTSSHTLANLIKIDIKLHKNYAFNFWLISYAIGEGPFVFHHVRMMEKNLKKLYPKNKEKFLLAKEAFIKTDFEIFYHKILMTSIRLIDLLNKNSSIKEKLRKAKKISLERRKLIYNQIISGIRKSKKANTWLLYLLKRHGENKAPIYNLLNQGLDFYQENIVLKKKLKDTRKVVEETLKFAKQKLTLEESKKLKSLYFLIREMLKAKDSTFGRKDLKLFNFWYPLTRKIVKLFEKKLNIHLKENEGGFLVIPWILEKHLSKYEKPRFNF